MRTRKRDMDREKEGMEKLRKDLFMALANRALIYTSLLREMRKELGGEKASEIFKQALFRHGVSMAELLNFPREMEKFKDWLLDFLPAGGSMHEPEVVSCNQEELVIRFARCPLKDAWRMYGLGEEEVADMCEHADHFDLGFFGSVFDYTMDLWSRRPDDRCVLTFRLKGGDSRRSGCKF